MLRQSLYILLLTIASCQAQICKLCGSTPVPPLARHDTFVNSFGYTCIDKAGEAMGLPDGSNACSNIKKRYQQMCCDLSVEPPVFEQTMDKIEHEEGNMFARGPHPPCHICPIIKDGRVHKGKYPGDPNHKAAILGETTPVQNCRGLFWFGRLGNVEERLCRPMQNYYKVPCACQDGFLLLSDQEDEPVQSNGGGAPDQETPPVETKPETKPEQKPEEKPEPGPCVEDENGDCLPAKKQEDPEDDGYKFYDTTERGGIYRHD